MSINLYNLIASLYIIPKKTRLILINSVKKKTISENKLMEVLIDFKKAQNEIAKDTKNIKEIARMKYINVIKKSINNSIIRLQQINLEIDESIFNEQEWNPDNILNIDEDIWQ